MQRNHKTSFINLLVKVKHMEDNFLPDALEMLFKQTSLDPNVACSNSREAPFLPGGTRYIPGWGGAARPLIP